MLYNLTPQYVHKIDQRLAQMNDVLDVILGVHATNLNTIGQDQAMLFIAEGLAVDVEKDPNLVIDLLTVAINRLAKQ